uniref:Phosphatidylinositol transfer protein n=1 Tax=Rhabditophanes sp. KR3021 TaxID=114890 RepID=A0AC35U4K2_9BILA
MIVKEYRVVLPMSVEEYQVGQLWSVAEASKAETGGGYYTSKIYHLQSKVPTLIRKIAPKGSLAIHEEAWNAYPYCRTILTNPDYMKDKFYVKVETIHLPDNGTTENAHGLTTEELAKREVVMINIANDKEFLNAADIQENTRPSTFQSQKTGRGPLIGNWKEEVKPVMCAYKLQYPRLFSKFHREVFCWIDNWIELTMVDIRRIEEEARKELEEARKTGKVRGMTSN